MRIIGVDNGLHFSVLFFKIKIDTCGVDCHSDEHEYMHSYEADEIMSKPCSCFYWFENIQTFSKLNK